MLFVRVLGSWFPNIQQFSIVKLIHHYTDPYLNLFRRLMPPLGAIDLSPALAFLALKVVEKILLTIVH